MDKKVLTAAVGNLRKELRSHGGKKLMPEEKPKAPAEPPAEEVIELDDPKKAKK